MMPQKHTPLQSFPFDIRIVEKRCSYGNTIFINLVLIKSKRNSDVVNILDMYVKDCHFLANSAPEGGNVSDHEKSGKSRNFPLVCKIRAEPAPRRSWYRPPTAFLPPAAPFLSAAKEIGERTPPKTDGFWISFRRLPPHSGSSEMLNRRISLRAAAFALKCAGACPIKLTLSGMKKDAAWRLFYVSV